MENIDGATRVALQRTTATVRELDRLATQPLCSNLSVFTPTSAEISELVEGAKCDMPILASTQVIQRVAHQNPDSFWAIRRSRIGKSRPLGFVAFLMLNEAGFAALLSGELKAYDPAPHFLVGQHQSPAAIYVWALHAKGLSTPALALVMDKLQSPNYRDADFVARAATEEGAKFLRAIGFLEDRAPSGITLFHYARRNLIQGGIGPSLDCSNRPRVSAKIVHTFEEFQRVQAIRSAVYFGEEECPFDEEFDGNDFSAGHVLGTVDAEPAGCLRVRYFAGFAKLERLAVRSRFRGLGLAKEMVTQATEVCRTKGYTKFYLHARRDKVQFWRKFGFDVSKNAEFAFSDFSYVEMIANYTPHTAPIGVGVDPLVILRPEGQWRKPGVLERSALRSPRSQNPSQSEVAA